MTRALQTIPQEPEADTSAEIYLTGAYFLLPLSLPFGSVLLLGLVALRVPGAQILAVGWYIFFLSFGPALIAVWCLYTCGAYDADALRARGVGLVLPGAPPRFGLFSRRLAARPWVP